MDDVGTRLRAARDRQRLTLENVALRTRIPTAVLEDIEHNAFDRLPGAIFTRGHLRAYATVLGLDPEEIVAAYLMRWPAAASELPIFRQPVVEEHGDRGRILAPAVAIAAVLLAYGVLREPGEPTVTMPTPRPAAVAAAPVATHDVADNAVALAASAEPGISLDVHATAECWLSAVADDELVVHRLLQEGEQVAVRAAGELVVRIGDPGAFAYTLNGAPGRALGDAGVPVTVTITEENWRTFVDGSEAEPALSDAAAV
jgi:cytoskeletal protein RodZ